MALVKIKKNGLLSPTGIITSLFLAILLPFLPYTDSAFASKEDAQARRGTKSFLGSSQDNVQTPIVEEDFFRCNGTHSVHDNLRITDIRPSMYREEVKRQVTRVSGETRFVSSAIARALDKTPRTITRRVNIR